MTKLIVSLPVYAVGNGEGNMAIFSVGEKPKDERAVLLTRENANYWLNRSNIGGADAELTIYITDTPMEARASANILRYSNHWDAQVTYNRLPCGYGAALLAAPPKRTSEVTPEQVVVLDQRQSGDDVEVIGSWLLTEAQLAEIDQPEAFKAVGNAIGAHMAQAVSQIDNPVATKAAQNGIEREAVGADVSFFRFDIDEALKSCFSIDADDASFSDRERKALHAAIVQAAEHFSVGSDFEHAVEEIRGSMMLRDEVDLFEWLEDGAPKNDGPSI